MKTNETIKWQEEQALRRYQLIAPLLDESLDNAKRIQMREAIAEQNGLSPRPCSPGSPKAFHDGEISLQSRIRCPADADVQRCSEKFCKTVLQTAPDDADPGRH